MSSRRWDIALVISLALLAVLFGIFLGPNVLGDTPTYTQAIGVLQGGAIPAGFIPNRLLTTFGGLEIIRALAPIFGDASDSVYIGWFFLNLMLYVASCIVFYRLLARMFGSDKVAYLGAMFLAANYGYLLFGLNYLMDIGGWSFYVFALFFIYAYSQSKKPRDLFLAALMVGVGGLFKEYAFLGGVALVTLVVLGMFFGPKPQGDRRLVRFGLPSLSILVMIIPTMLLYAYIYHRFGYTYLDWLGANAAHYVYHSRILEYIKALGSLMNVLGLLFLGGLAVLIGRWRETARETHVFIIAAFVSFLPVFLWPAITQRILTIAVPFAIIVACFLFKRYESRWYLFLPALALYALATFFMDSYILKAVNLPF